MSLVRTRPPNPIRSAMHDAMLTPRVQQAVSGFVQALLDESEAILRERYAGDHLRVYMPKRGGRDQAEARRARVHALAAEPSRLTPHQIADIEQISPRRVRQILAAGPPEGKSSG